ncbi:MAG: heparinase II/III family protein [Deltaproteobacteria bacterium]|jgi:hypothetical protein|nr:heparinase II/III family protein [Deltaproteobacteria bacterium]MBW2534889.1 heparinase II/III family protein [Deltaproteobacteria bacterium]
MHHRARLLTFALATALVVPVGCSDDADDATATTAGTSSGTGAGTSSGTSSGTPGGTPTGAEPFDEEGWHPSSDRDPYYFLQPDDLFRVHPTHPRLYFRSEDIDWMIARGAGPLGDQWSNLEWMASSMAEEDPAGATATDDVKGWYGAKGRAVTLLALLQQNDTYRDWSVAWAKALGDLPVPSDDTPLRARLQRMAVVYDWLYDRMSDADRTEIREGMIPYLEALRDWGYIEDPGYIGGHERWGYAAFAMALIALYDEYPDAPQLVEQCREHIARGFFPTQAWIAEDGGYHMGWAYTASYTDFDLPYLVWTVGTNDVVLDDWLAETGDWYLYGVRGDDHFAQAGDAFSIGLGLGATNSIYAAGIGDRGTARWYVENKIQPTSESFLQLLVFDPDVEATPPDGLPKGRLFQHAGLVVARDEWGAGTTHFAFKSGAFFSINHHHRDENTFTLHYQAPLAIDSGHYDSYGTEHWRNYYTRTVAHNGIVVFDPTQTMTLYGNDVSNDGGQLFRQEPRRLAEIQPGGHASLDGIRQFEDRDEFTYGFGDATKAYDAERVSLAQREVVYLREISRAHPAVVVFDRVTSTSASLQKRFLLHTVEQPTVQGRLMVAEHAGGRLTSATVFPPTAQLTLVGGAGSQYLVDGVNYPLDPNGNEGDAASKGIFPGAWRLEVNPGQSATEDYFLHVLFVDDVGAAAVAAGDARLIDETDALGVQVADWAVVFPRSSSGMTGVSYALPAGGTAKHLVAGLPLNQTVEFSVNGTSQGTVQVGSGGCALLELSASAGDTVTIHQ